MHMHIDDLLDGALARRRVPIVMGDWNAVAGEQAEDEAEKTALEALALAKGTVEDSF